MASRQNRSGRRDGYGSGPLSKVYSRARNQSQANRRAGKPPGSRLGITQEQVDAGITSPEQAMAQQSPLDKIKARARERGGLRGMAEGARKMAPGLDQLTGGEKPVTAAVMPGSTRVSEGVKRGMGAEGARLLASRGVNTRPKPVIDHSAFTPNPASFGAIGERPPPAASPVETMGAPELAAPAAPAAPTANATGVSPRSRGLSRSVRRRRAPEDRG